MLSDEETEKRQRPRMNLPLRASMDFGRNTPKHACMIRNISEGGARLHVGLLLDPPEYFDLSISSVGNFRRPCKLVWRSEFDIGVKFIPHNYASVAAGGTVGSTGPHRKVRAAVSQSAQRCHWLSAWLPDFIF
jgi:hypothetical protein